MLGVVGRRSAVSCSENRERQPAGHAHYHYFA
jgi:hypothetical protein